MAKKRKTGFQYARLEWYVMLFLLVVLVASSVMLISKNKKGEPKLIEPITIQQ